MDERTVKLTYMLEVKHISVRRMRVSLVLLNALIGDAALAEQRQLFMQSGITSGSPRKSVSLSGLSN